MPIGSQKYTKVDFFLCSKFSTQYIIFSLPCTLFLLVHRVVESVEVAHIILKMVKNKFKWFWHIDRKYVVHVVRRGD